MGPRMTLHVSYRPQWKVSTDRYLMETTDWQGFLGIRPKGGRAVVLSKRIGSRVKRIGTSPTYLETPVSRHKMEELVSRNHQFRQFPRALLHPTQRQKNGKGVMRVATFNINNNQQAPG